MNNQFLSYSFLRSKCPMCRTKTKSWTTVSNRYQAYPTTFDFLSDREFNSTIEARIDRNKKIGSNKVHEESEEAEYDTDDDSEYEEDLSVSESEYDVSDSDDDLDNSEYEEDPYASEHQYYESESYDEPDGINDPSFDPADYGIGEEFEPGPLRVEVGNLDSDLDTNFEANNCYNCVDL